MAYEGKTNWLNGDIVKAEDMNRIETALQTSTHTIDVDVPLEGWTGDGPWQQTISIPGMQETDTVGIFLAADNSTPAETVKIYRKQAGNITSGEVLDNQLILQCANKKPTADFKIRLLGVSKEVENV